MYLFCFYVPSDHCEAVKAACFAAGAGQIGNYDCCAWETDGTGQYRPLTGSQPYKGTQGKIKKVQEVKVEMVVDGDLIDDVIEALLLAHPYEKPAFQYWQVANDPR